MTAGHDPDDGAVRQARAYSAEMYLRLLVEAELRRAVGYWRLGLPGAGSAPRPVPAAGEGMDRVRAAAEALTAIGAIEDVTAHSVLTEFTSALAVRSKVPLRMLNEVPLARWNQRRLPPVSAGTPDERLLDSIAENLLWSSLWHDDENPERSRLAAMAAALRGASAVKPSSPALARYAALSRRLRIAGRGESRAAADLPPAWNDVLAGRGKRDGREEVMPVAAVLPEIDGARFALTGLSCSDEAATLRALAWGWRPEDEPLNQTPFSWWARDSARRWHVARQVWSSLHHNGAVLDIMLIPPLHPAAISLEIIVTGSSERAVATVPLLR